MTSQFGSKIINHFNSPRRGENTGKNDHGVPIEFLLVSVEEETFWDDDIESIRANNGFPAVALDLAPNRIDAIRASFAHFRGEAFTPEPGSLPFADRRRIVILNMVEKAVDLGPREILHNDLPQSSGALSARDEAAIKAAINRVEPEVSLPDNDGDGDPDETDPDDDNDGLLDIDELAYGLDPLLADSDGNGIPDGDEDPDRDGFTNAQELNLLLTDPHRGNSRFEFEVLVSGGNHSLSFPTLDGRRYAVEGSIDGDQFDEVSTVPGTGSVEQVNLGPILDVQLYRVRIEFND